MPRSPSSRTSRSTRLRSPACPSPGAAQRGPGVIRNCRGTRRGFPGLSSSAPCPAIPAAIPGGPASRRIPISICSAPGRPPRPVLHRRQAHGPAGRLLWEDILPREIGSRTPQDLFLLLQQPVTAPQLSELFLLAAGQAVTAAILLSVGLAHPVPHARIADAQIPGDPGGR